MAEWASSISSISLAQLNCSRLRKTAIAASEMGPPYSLLSSFVNDAGDGIYGTCTARDRHCFASDLLGDGLARGAAFLYGASCRLPFLRDISFSLAALGACFEEEESELGMVTTIEEAFCFLRYAISRTCCGVTAVLDTLVSSATAHFDAARPPRNMSGIFGLAAGAS